MTIRAVVLFTPCRRHACPVHWHCLRVAKSRIASMLHDIGARIVMGEAARSAAARVRRRIRGAPRVGHLSGETGGMAIIFLVLWTTLYLALVIFIAWDVLTQALKPRKGATQRRIRGTQEPSSGAGL
jgi:hypothetical protein